VTNFHAELERIYFSYEAELAAVQADITRCEQEANGYRARFTALLNDRAEAVKRLSREHGQ
jgi:hypothetical protein